MYTGYAILTKNEDCTQGMSVQRFDPTRDKTQQGWN